MNDLFFGNRRRALSVSSERSGPSDADPGLGLATLGRTTVELGGARFTVYFPEPS